MRNTPSTPCAFACAAMLSLFGCQGSATVTGPVIAPPPAPVGSPNPETPPSPHPSGDSVIGHYTLLLEVGSGCDAIPDAARSRRYTATIDSTGDAAYIVTLGGSQFLSGPICTDGTAPLTGVGCNQFLGSRTGDSLEFRLVSDDYHGGDIVEQLPFGTWIEISGTATGQLEQQTIKATGMGAVWYCPTAKAYPFPCDNFVSCRSSDMRLAFERTVAD